MFEWTRLSHAVRISDPSATDRLHSRRRFLRTGLVAASAAVTLGLWAPHTTLAAEKNEPRCDPELIKPPHGSLADCRRGYARSEPPVAPTSGFAWPARGEITTYFGEVSSVSPRGHAGLDIAAPWGSPVVAAEGGEVVEAGMDGSGYGIRAIIRHASGLTTLYAHLSSLAVEAGEPVRRGQSVGRMGNTGFSTGSHLHFEVREEGSLRDPLRYLA